MSCKTGDGSNLDSEPVCWSLVYILCLKALSTSLSQNKYNCFPHAWSTATADKESIVLNRRGEGKLEGHFKKWKNFWEEVIQPL